MLVLPPDDNEWLVHSVERLICQKCAYWVSLRSAPESENETNQTIYLPKNNFLSVEKLRDIMARFSRMEEINYEQ